MSVDRKTLCPRCTKRAEDAQVALLAKLQQVYGEVSEQEYRVLLEEIMAHLLDCTLREDGSVGIMDGVFEVSYQAHCVECGFRKSYSHWEAIEL